MDVRFYNWERELLCIVPRIQSVNWYVYFKDVGTFEMHMNANAPQVKILLEEKHLIATCGKLQAVIVIKKTEKHELVLYGRTLNWLLTKRVVTPFEERKRDTIEEIKSVLPEYMQFNEFAEEVTETAETVERTTAETVEAFISSLLDDVALGYEVRFEKGEDGKASYVFNILEGQEIKVSLSEEERNVHELVFTDDALDYCSSGWYLNGEQWLKIDKDNKKGIYDFEGILTSDNKSGAAGELNELRWKRSCEGKVKQLRYQKDYNLGDIIKIKFKKGDFRLTTRYRITGVHVWYEGTNEGEEPAFEEVI